MSMSIMTFKKNFRETHNSLSDFCLFPKLKVAPKGRKGFDDIITIQEKSQGALGKLKTYDFCKCLQQ
jgi:hypothetical protein